MKHRFQENSPLHTMAEAVERVGELEAKLSAVGTAVANYESAAVGFTDNLNAVTTLEGMRNFLGFYLGGVHTALLAINTALAEPEE